MKKRFTKFLYVTFFTLVFVVFSLQAQVNTGGTANTTNHSKQIIGYVTEWDAWKAAENC
jgi:hypothetical protein